MFNLAIEILQLVNVIYRRRPSIRYLVEISQIFIYETFIESISQIQPKLLYCTPSGENSSDDHKDHDGVEVLMSICIFVMKSAGEIL